MLAAVTITIGALYFATDMRDRLRPAGPGKSTLAKMARPAMRRAPFKETPVGRGPASAGDETGGGTGSGRPATAGTAASGGTGNGPGRDRRQSVPGGAASRNAGRRRRRDGREAEPSTAVRWWLVVSGVALAMGATFALGFWVIGNGFAHSLARSGCGPWPASSRCWPRPCRWRAAAARAPGWLSWLRAWRNGVLAIGVSAIGLSSGATLGYAQLLPAAVPAAPCPPPTELRVLAASEVLGPLQAAITDYEQDERARFATSCYAVDITAYAAGNDKAADDGIIGGWNLADGPRPDIWVPASSEELPVNTSPADNPQVNLLGSVASSPVVIAVPSGLVTPALRQYESDYSLPDIYEAIKGGFTLQVPNPRLSETARLGLADLYPALSPADQARIGDSVSFPTDSGSLLCQSAPARPTAYLVSAVTVDSEQPRRPRRRGLPRRSRRPQAQQR